MGVQVGVGEIVGVTVKVVAMAHVIIVAWDSALVLALFLA